MLVTNDSEAKIECDVDSVTVTSSQQGGSPWCLDGG